MTVGVGIFASGAALLLWLLPPIHTFSAPLPPSRVQDNIRLVSWNLLAPVFTPREKYPWCSPEHLSWPYREKLIVSELQRMDADLVCLQEVQTEFWNDFLEDLPQYEGILQNVTNGHPVTNAVLFRKGRFQVLRQESRSRALILVLDHLDESENSSTQHSGDRPLYLANVHLHAGMDEDETRVCQLKSLLKRLNTHVKKERSKGGKKGKDDEDDPPTCVIVGDFNMLPTNPVYRWLSHKQHETASIHGHSKQPEVAMHDVGTGEDLSHLKFPTRGQHMELLPLKDVYSDLPPTLLSSSDSDDHHCNSQQHNVQKTYCGGSVLDYIWTTTTISQDSATTFHSIDVSKTMVFHSQALQEGGQLWPSKEHPSDHLPVGFEFSWR